MKEGLGVGVGGEEDVGDGEVLVDLVVDSVVEAEGVVEGGEGHLSVGAVEVEGEDRSAGGGVAPEEVHSDDQ